MCLSQALSAPICIDWAARLRQKVSPGYLTEILKHTSHQDLHLLRLRLLNRKSADNTGDKKRDYYVFHYYNFSPVYLLSLKYPQIDGLFFPTGSGSAGGAASMSSLVFSCSVDNIDNSCFSRDFASTSSVLVSSS